MRTVERHCWTNDAKSQMALAKKGQQVFSHEDGLPLYISIKRSGRLCRKVHIETIEPVWYHDAVCSIEVPANFRCDLASIPRGLWFVISPYDIALESIFHDLAYRSQDVSRDYADYLFYHLMKLRGVPWYVRFPVYYAVRLFGKKAWERNARRKRHAKNQ